MWSTFLVRIAPVLLFPVGRHVVEWTIGTIVTVLAYASNPEESS